MKTYLRKFAIQQLIGHHYLRLSVRPRAYCITKMSKPNSTPPPASPEQPRDNHLLPTSRHDHASISHLRTLPPSHWTPLILFSFPTPPHYPGGLLTWLQDANWPISRPTASLLLTLLGPGNRETHGKVLIDALKNLFSDSDDWDWMYYLLTMIVEEIEDGEYVRRELGDVLGILKGRVPEQEERDWGFREVIVQCLGQVANE